MSCPARLLLRLATEPSPDIVRRGTDLAHECSSHSLFVAEAIADGNRLERGFAFLDRLTGRLNPQCLDELSGSHSGVRNAVASERPQPHAGSARQDLGTQIRPQIVGDP